MGNKDFKLWVMLSFANAVFKKVIVKLNDLWLTTEVQTKIKDNQVLMVSGATAYNNVNLLFFL